MSNKKPQYLNILLKVSYGNDFMSAPTHAIVTMMAEEVKQYLAIMDLAKFLKSTNEKFQSVTYENRDALYVDSDIAAEMFGIDLYTDESWHKEDDQCEIIVDMGPMPLVMEACRKDPKNERISAVECPEAEITLTEVRLSAYPKKTEADVRLTTGVIPRWVFQNFLEARGEK